MAPEAGRAKRKIQIAKKTNSSFIRKITDKKYYGIPFGNLSVAPSVNIHPNTLSRHCGFGLG